VAIVGSSRYLLGKYISFKIIVNQGKTMKKHFLKHISFLIVSLLIGTTITISKTVIFFEKDFPTIENSKISRQSLEKAFSSANPRFVNLSDLQKKKILTAGDLLVLPYGSALPVDAWETINLQLNQGHLLVLGGRPFFIPVYRNGNGWRTDYPQNTYSRYLGI